MVAQETAERPYRRIGPLLALLEDLTCQDVDVPSAKASGLGENRVAPRRSLTQCEEPFGVAHRIDQTESGSLATQLSPARLDNCALHRVQRVAVAHYALDGLTAPGENDRQGRWGSTPVALKGTHPRQ